MLKKVWMGHGWSSPNDMLELPLWEQALGMKGKQW